MSIRGATAFYVGFRGCSSAAGISSFLSGLLAFLTAKSLPLGIERDPGEDASQHLFHEAGFKIPYERAYYNSESREWERKSSELEAYHRLQLEKSASAMGRVCSAIGFTPGYKVFTLVRIIEKAAIDASPCRVKRVVAYRFNASAPQMQYRVLYNPAFCVSKFYALFKDAELDILRDGDAELDRDRLGRVLPLFLMSIAFVFAVVDVAVGAVMRVLQAPYYALMFLWHLRARDFETAIIHGLYEGYKAAEFQGSVFGAMDTAFTCFAVVLNSIVLGLVFYIHSGVLGFSAFEVNVMCGVLAVLTLVAVSLTVFNMKTANQWLRGEGQRMINAIWRKGGMAPLYTVGNGDLVLNEQESRQRDVVATHTRMTATLLYLSEIGRGACLPSHFRAGFGGTTAFSFVEEVLHAPSHLLASAAITLVERFFDDKGSSQLQPS